MSNVTENAERVTKTTKTTKTTSTTSTTTATLTQNEVRKASKKASTQTVVSNWPMCRMYSCGSLMKIQMNAAIPIT